MCNDVMRCIGLSQRQSFCVPSSLKGYPSFGKADGELLVLDGQVVE